MSLACARRATHLCLQRCASLLHRQPPSLPALGTQDPARRQRVHTHLADKGASKLRLPNGAGKARPWAQLAW